MPMLILRVDLPGMQVRQRADSCAQVNDGGSHGSGRTIMIFEEVTVDGRTGGLVVEVLYDLEAGPCSFSDQWRFARTYASSVNVISNHLIYRRIYPFRKLAPSGDNDR